VNTPEKGDIWRYSLGADKWAYYLILDVENKKDSYGWETLLLALNEIALSDTDGTHIPYSWYSGNMFWEKVA